jgi:hypothetical protein
LALRCLNLLTGFLVAAVLEFGCGKSTGSVDAGAGPFQRDWAKKPGLFEQVGAQEIDVLGDVHGDLLTTVHVLSTAGLISTSTPFHWTGGNRTLIVTGDVIDKGSMAIPIIDLLIDLEAEAAAAGGRLVVTLGNHEAEFLADPTDSKSNVFQAELLTRSLYPKDVAAGKSKYGAWLLTRPVAALIDGWFFCHAGNSDRLSAAAIGQTFQQRVSQPATAVGGVSGYEDSFLIGSNSLLEAQSWWQTGTNATATIDANLSALPAQHIVFGHEPGSLDFPDDPQGNRAKGQMVSRYDGRIFLVDVGEARIGQRPCTPTERRRICGRFSGQALTVRLWSACPNRTSTLGGRCSTVRGPRTDALASSTTSPLDWAPFRCRT